MVQIAPQAHYFGSDNFWDSEVDYRVYEKLEREKPTQRAYFIAGFEDTAGTMRNEQIRMAKARAMDKARKKLIKDTREKARNTFPDFFGDGQKSGSRLTRTVGGVEGVPDSAIMI